MDPATTQAVAKAAEETAKTTGKAHDTGGYLRQVFGELIVNAVGWLIGDWVSQKRYRNVDALFRRTSEILHERDVKEAIELSPNQAVELLTGAQDESRPELAELWARLLANAMDPNLNSVRQSFIDAAKGMDPPDVLVLEYIAKKRFSSVLPEFAGGGAAPNQLAIIAADMALRPDDVELSVRHLQSLLFFEPIGNGGWRTTVTLRGFARACYPELGTLTEPLGIRREG